MISSGSAVKGKGFNALLHIQSPLSITCNRRRHVIPTTSWFENKDAPKNPVPPRAAQYPSQEPSSGTKSFLNSPVTPPQSPGLSSLSNRNFKPPHQQQQEQGPSELQAGSSQENPFQQLQTDIKALSDIMNAFAGVFTGGGLEQESSTAVPMPVDGELGSPELQNVESSLRERDAEIAALKTKLAEQDARLKASRSDLLESRAALTETRDALAAVSAERSVLRLQLTATTADLNETRAELESLADDVLTLLQYTEYSEDGARSGVERVAETKAEQEVEFEAWDVAAIEELHQQLEEAKKNQQHRWSP